MDTKFTVVGHTPGYLSEDDDPPVFDTIEEARGYLNDEYARVLDQDEDGNLEVFFSHDSDGHPEAIVIEDKTKIHDLGYIIEILEYDVPGTCRTCGRPCGDLSMPNPCCVQ